MKLVFQNTMKDNKMTEESEEYFGMNNNCWFREKHIYSNKFGDY